MCPILNAIRELNLSTEQRVWIAVSGGLDSTVLLHACVQVLGASTCRVLHINHQLSSVAPRWVEHVIKISEQWGVSVVVETVDVSKGNIEQQARLSRYEVFRNKLAEREFLLTAHHQNDDIETLYWQLFTGRASIGIPQARSLGSGVIVRPFLQLTRPDLEKYAATHGLTWIEDESNANTSMDRNWLRHKLLPQLEMRFPQSNQHILKLKEDCLAGGARQPLAISGNNLTADHIRSWLLAYELSPSTAVIKEILLQARGKIDTNPKVKIGERVYVRRYQNQLYVVRDFESFEPLQVVVGTTVNLGNGTLSWTEASEGFEPGRNLLCTNRVHLPENRRVIKQGAIHKKFAKLFQEAAIPPWLRDGWPVLCTGHTVVSLVDVTAVAAASCLDLSKQKFLPSWQPFE